jgi:hypothetical protein
MYLAKLVVHKVKINMIGELGLWWQCALAVLGLVPVSQSRQVSGAVARIAAISARSDSACSSDTSRSVVHSLPSAAWSAMPPPAPGSSAGPDASGPCAAIGGGQHKEFTRGRYPCFEAAAHVVKRYDEVLRSFLH